MCTSVGQLLQQNAETLHYRWGDVVGVNVPHWNRVTPPKHPICEHRNRLHQRTQHTSISAISPWDHKLVTQLQHRKSPALCISNVNFTWINFAFHNLSSFHSVGNQITTKCMAYELYSSLASNKYLGEINEYQSKTALLSLHFDSNMKRNYIFPKQ